MPVCFLFISPKSPVVLPSLHVTRGQVLSPSAARLKGTKMLRGLLVTVEPTTMALAPFGAFQAVATTVGTTVTLPSEATTDRLTVLTGTAVVTGAVGF